MCVLQTRVEADAEYRFALPAASTVCAWQPLSNDLIYRRTERLPVKLPAIVQLQACSHFADVTRRACRGGQPLRHPVASPPRLECTKANEPGGRPIHVVPEPTADLVEGRRIIPLEVVSEFRRCQLGDVHRP